MPLFTYIATALIASFMVTPISSHPTHSHRHLHHKRWDTECIQLGQGACGPATPAIKVIEPVSAADTSIITPSVKYDLDNNGVQDWCDPINGNQAECLAANGQWTTVDATPTTIVSAKLPKGSLPSAATWKTQNGTKDASGKGWSITKKGVLGFSGQLGAKGVVGDKARTGSIGGKVIWNFGDVMCEPDYKVCGFDMGPAMYGTDSVMTVDTKNISTIQDAKFIAPHASSSNFFANEFLGNDCKEWGMDNSNVAPLNSTHGIVYSWQIWRACPTADGKNDAYEDRGLAASVITLGEKFPIATRVSGLLAGADSVAAGLVGITTHEGYVYSYTVETTADKKSAVIVGRARTDDENIFSSAQSHEFYSPTAGAWVRGIPPKSAAAEYNLITAQPGGWNCAVYGSVLYSNFLDKWMLFCDAWMSEFLFYTADKPEGPWSETYEILTGLPGWYGAHVHPEFSLGGSHERLYISMGPNRQFDVWEVDFGGYRV